MSKASRRREGGTVSATPMFERLDVYRCPDCHAGIQYIWFDAGRGLGNAKRVAERMGARLVRAVGRLARRLPRLVDGRKRP